LFHITPAHTGTNGARLSTFSSFFTRISVDGSRLLALLVVNRVLGSLVDAPLTSRC